MTQSDWIWYDQESRSDQKIEELTRVVALLTIKLEIYHFLKSHGYELDINNSHLVEDANYDTLRLKFKTQLPEDREYIDLYLGTRKKGLLEAKLDIDLENDLKFVLGIPLNGNSQSIQTS